VPDRASHPPVGHDPVLNDPSIAPSQGTSLNDTLGDLADGERILAELRGIGASMFVTTVRIVVARDGRERRPRSGMQSFALSDVSHIRVEPGARPSGRIAVLVGGEEAVSMFFDARSSERAQDLVEIARPVMVRLRRRREQTARPTRC
jgi:hypothetical protein